MSKTPLEIELSLNTMEALFAEPDADPFDPDSRYISGIDEVMAHMRLRPRDLNNTSRLTLRLPQTAVSPDIQSTLKAALDRYCNAKIAENQQVIDELKIGSRRQTISAFFIMAVLVLLTITLLYFIPQLQTVIGAIIGFVGIAIWVILWDPIYNYVYAWRPNYLNIQVCKNLLMTQLVVETA